MDEIIYCQTCGTQLTKSYHWNEFVVCHDCYFWLIEKFGKPAEVKQNEGK